jgi:hypothetical protein
LPSPALDVFLSYSRSDLEAANALRAQLEAAGLSVFKDDASIREGDLWLDKLQHAVADCGAFVLLVGRDGVQRWVGAEAQVALSRHFGPKADDERLPIFPVLLPDTSPEALPAFLRLFQARPWNPDETDQPLSVSLITQIRKRQINAAEGNTFEGCPFVGLAAYQIDQAHLFFGRQKETLDALACFDTRPASPVVRWLEINGNSGAGKSSLMQAGMLPLVDQGWLWPRTGFEHWHRIGPMMPGERPVTMLAEHLARAFSTPDCRVEMADVADRLRARRISNRQVEPSGGGRGGNDENSNDNSDEQALTHWLRSRKRERTAFLLAIDQFEELFTVADADERRTFDRLLAAALDDPDCPLFVISTVRSDFLDRFAEELPRLTAVRNRLSRPWTLAPISTDGLREVIDGPARLAGLDVSEVREAIVADAGDEPGALPLVENALHYLWERRQDGRLSGALFNALGGLAGILSKSADALLNQLEGPKQRGRALELLFELVRVDPEGRRHTRRRVPLPAAIHVAGGNEDGRKLIDHLAGRRSREARPGAGPLRLITVIEDAGEAASTESPDASGAWVNLIHETLIRRKAPDAQGQQVPYWPTLWNYVEANQQRAARRQRLQLMAREWDERKGASRLFGLAGWASLFGFRRLAAPKSREQRYLRWSRGARRWRRSYSAWLWGS